MNEYDYTETTSTTAETSYETPVRYPGKEIAVLILGINALVWAAMTAFTAWIPLYGFIFLVVWGGLSLACIIVCNKFYKTVKTFATETTPKLETGKKLNKIGTIILIIDAVISVLVGIISVIALVAAGTSSYFH